MRPLAPKPFKVKKKYGIFFDELINNGKTEVYEFTTWRHLMKYRKENKVFDSHTIRHNHFLLTLTKPITKDKRRSSGGKYNYYFQTGKTIFEI
jgi:hypothetical protein